MTTKREHRLAIALVALAMILAPAVGAAQGFSGYFDWSEASPEGEEVWVTLTIELVNHSGDDAFDLTLHLESPLDPDAGPRRSSRVDGSEREVKV